MLPLNSNISKSCLERVGSFWAVLVPDTRTLPGRFFLPRILWGQQLRRNQTHVLWLELPFTPRLGTATVQPPAQQARGWQLPEAKPLCQQFSAALTSLRFKAWPGKVGRTKHLMRVSVHSFEHPGLPWGRGKTESCLFFREAGKGLRQQASIKGSSQQRGLRN